MIVSLAVALYAIVGGPSVGKTAIIQELNDMGEIVVEEAATGYIQRKQKEGIIEPWNDENFDLILLNIYLKNVANAKEKANQLAAKRIFTDRGVLDHFVYSELLGRTNTLAYLEIEKIIGSLNVENYYDAVFYIHPHNGLDFQTIQTDVRHENTEEAKIIISSLYHMYKSNLPKVIEVPPYMSPRARALFILNKIEELS